MVSVAWVYAAALLFGVRGASAWPGTVTLSEAAALVDPLPPVRTRMLRTC